MSGSPDGTVNIGSNDVLVRRVSEHREGQGPEFTSRYSLERLVRHEAFESGNPFRRGRQMKVWRRAWKIELIEKANPGWRDLHPEIC